MRSSVLFFFFLPRGKDSEDLGSLEDTQSAIFSGIEKRYDECLADSILSFVFFKQERKISRCYDSKNSKHYRE